MNASSLEEYQKILSADNPYKALGALGNLLKVKSDMLTADEQVKKALKNVEALRTLNESKMLIFQCVAVILNLPVNPENALKISNSIADIYAKRLQRFVAECLASRKMSATIDKLEEELKKLDDYISKHERLVAHTTISGPSVDGNAFTRVLDDRTDKRISFRGGTDAGGVTHIHLLLMMVCRYASSKDMTVQSFERDDRTKLEANNLQELVAESVASAGDGAVGGEEYFDMLSGVKAASLDESCSTKVLLIKEEDGFVNSNNSELIRTNVKTTYGGVKGERGRGGGGQYNSIPCFFLF